MRTPSKAPHSTPPGIDPAARRGAIARAALAAASLLAPWAVVGDAWAREAESDTTAPAPCAIIAEVGGQVDVLDSSRTHLLDSSTHAPIPCGSWISVGHGSIQLKHRDGFRIHASSGTFAQFPEPNTDGKYSGEQAVLFRGQLFAQAGGGSGQLRVLTANARARVQRGSAFVIYSQEDEETQVIALERSSTLENRFQDTRRVQVNAGEATSLNFKQLRVVPATPRAVALAALRPKFEDLHVPERDRQTALGNAKNRQERDFASELVESEDPDRKPAAAKLAAVSAGDPGQEVRAHLEGLKSARHFAPPAATYSSRPSDAQVQRIRKSWVNRLVAGEGGAEHFVAPRKRAEKSVAHASQKEGGSAAVRVPERKPARALTSDDEEKLRLIEELSRIREE